MALGGTRPFDGIAYHGRGFDGLQLGAPSHLVGQRYDRDPPQYVLQESGTAHTFASTRVTPSKTAPSLPFWGAPFLSTVQMTHILASLSDRSTIVNEKARYISLRRGTTHRLVFDVRFKPCVAARTFSPTVAAPPRHRVFRIMPEEDGRKLEDGHIFPVEYHIFLVTPSEPKQGTETNPPMSCK
jgi:hypothetical protein